MSFVTRLSLHLGVVVMLGVVLLFGGGIYAATQEPIEATRKMRIDMAGVRAASNAEASNRAMEMVRRVIPSNGYHLAEYDVIHKERETATAGARS